MKFDLEIGNHMSTVMVRKISFCVHDLDNNHTFPFLCLLIGIYIYGSYFSLFFLTSPTARLFENSLLDVAPVELLQTFL